MNAPVRPTSDTETPPVRAGFLRRWGLWAITLGWAAGIFLLSSLPIRLDETEQIPGKDKTIHLTIYAVLGGLLAATLVRTHRMSGLKAAALAIVLVSAYGASDEVHQSFVPNRNCDWLDWVADTIGGGAAAAIWSFYETRRSSKKNR